MQALEENADIVKAAEIVLVAVKPHHVRAMLESLQQELADKLLISIAAGIQITQLEAWAGASSHSPRRVVRAMPNTPALVGAGATAFARGCASTSQDGSVSEQIFRAVGMAVEVPESLLDAVTGLSGSGPAFAFMAIEAMADGGVAEGLPRTLAQRLAAQTLLGAARMVLETSEHPGVLKDAVTSPGGTTIQGIASLEESGFRSAWIKAIAAASRRARELSQG